MNHCKIYAATITGCLISLFCTLQAKTKQDAFHTTQVTSKKHRDAQVKKLEHLESHNLIQQWAEKADPIITGVDAQGKPLSAEQIKNLMPQADELGLKIIEKINASKHKNQEKEEFITAVKEFFNDFINENQHTIAQANPDKDKEHIAVLTRNNARFKNALQTIEQDGFKAMFFNPSAYKSA